MRSSARSYGSHSARTRHCTVHSSPLRRVHCVWYRYGWPLCPLVPNPRVRCLTVRGERVECPRWDASRGPVPAALVEETHAKYVAALRRLYNEHRHLHEAYKEKPLEIW